MKKEEIIVKVQFSMLSLQFSVLSSKRNEGYLEISLSIFSSEFSLRDYRPNLNLRLCSPKIEPSTFPK